MNGNASIEKNEFLIRFRYVCAMLKSDHTSLSIVAHATVPYSLRPQPQYRNIQIGRPCRCRNPNRTRPVLIVQQDAAQVLREELDYRFRRDPNIPDLSTPLGRAKLEESMAKARRAGYREIKTVNAAGVVSSRVVLLCNEAVPGDLIVNLSAETFLVLREVSRGFYAIVGRAHHRLWNMSVDWEVRKGLLTCPAIVYWSKPSARRHIRLRSFCSLLTLSIW